MSFGRLAAVSLLVGLGAGCLVDRTPLGPTTGLDAFVPDGVDAGRVEPGPDAARDGAAPCTPSECDDGNLCTDDACGASGCTHTPNAAACDDGVLCNGGDTCSAGACSVHDGVDPCPAPTSCDVATDACLGCTSAADCPAPMTGPFGSCTFAPGDLCGESGTRSRTVTSYACVASACVPSETTESEACARDTDGITCGATTTGDFGACTYADETCSTEGTRSRTVTSFTCSGGACAPTGIEETDTAGCDRRTDGISCGMDETSAWSACMGTGADVCATAGMRSRTTTRFVCAGGACGRASSTESEACTRTTDGTTCGPPTCDAFGACTRTNPTSCSTAGTRSRSCRPSLCSAGSCTTGAVRMETEACTVSPIGGLPCATAMDCTVCLEPGMARCRSGRAGEQFCSDGTGTCTSGTIGDPTCIETTAVRTACTCP